MSALSAVYSDARVDSIANTNIEGAVSSLVKPETWLSFPFAFYCVSVLSAMLFMFTVCGFFKAGRCVHLSLYIMYKIKLFY